MSTFHMIERCYDNDGNPYPVVEELGELLNERGQLKTITSEILFLQAAYQFLRTTDLDFLQLLCRNELESLSLRASRGSFRDLFTADLPTTFKLFRTA
jgi:hypothetical protein